MEKKTFDIITTLLLALIPFLLFFGEIIKVYVAIPVEYLVVINLVLAVLSQYAANQRVKDAVEEVKTYEVIDYLTTFIFAVGPIIIAFQSIIMQNIPIAYIPVATIFFGVLSQIVSNKRSKAAIRA